MPSQKCITPRITRRPVSAFMRLAIDLDAQLGGIAVEIEIIFARGVLVSPF